MSDNSSERPSNKAAITVIAEIVGLWVFYLYFGGWVYASDLFGRFGLSLAAIEIPVYYFIVYAYRVFFQSLSGWLMLLSLGTGWYVLSRVRFIRSFEIVLLL